MSEHQNNNTSQAAWRIGSQKSLSHVLMRMAQSSYVEHMDRLRSLGVVTSVMRENPPRTINEIRSFVTMLSVLSDAVDEYRTATEKDFDRLQAMLERHGIFISLNGQLHEGKEAAVAIHLNRNQCNSATCLDHLPLNSLAPLHRQK